MRDFRHRIVRGDGMGYKIVYGDGPWDYDKKVESGSRVRILTAGCLLLFCMLVRMLWPEGCELLRDVILPGELSATEQSFQVMLSDLRLGEPMKDALRTFCMDVVHNGT